MRGVPDEALAVARRLPVEPAALRDGVEALSAIGSRPDGFRVTGTPEDHAAAALSAQRLRDAGLSDVAVEPVPVDGWRLAGATLELTGTTISGASFGGAPGTPPGGVRGPLVDVRTGERRRLDRLDLEGRIALVDWHTLAVAPADVALELGSRGVVGLVLACFEGGPFYQSDGEAAGSFDARWHPEGPPVLTVARDDAAALRARLGSGEQAATLTVDARSTPGAEGHNVVGYLPGELGPPTPPIVIGAHHDGWFAGAFDNATGVAALVALAAGLAELGHRPRHTLCFTSRTAEEHGVLDCAFDWCTGAWEQIQRTHPEWQEAPFHLCLEASGHPGLRTIVEAPVELRRFARAACRVADDEGWLTAGWRVGPPVTGTEQWPYLISGVPGVATYAWETSFRRTAYHTPLDHPGIVDYDHLARVVRAYALILLAADADPDGILDHRARARHLARAADGLGEDGAALAAAARAHGEHARGRSAFTPVGRGLHAVTAADGTAYPHAQADTDRRGLDAALDALAADDRRAATKALAGVGHNRQARTLSPAVFAAHRTREQPDAGRLAWGAASHLTAGPDLWQELATLREEPGCRPPGDWLTASLHRHRDAARADLRRRTEAMTLALAPRSPELS